MIKVYAITGDKGALVMFFTTKELAETIQPKIQTAASWGSIREFNVFEPGDIEAKEAQQCLNQKDS